MKTVSVTLSLKFDYEDMTEEEALADAMDYVGNAHVSLHEFDYSIQTIDTDS